jgi:hypothetical protein
MADTDLHTRIEAAGHPVQAHLPDRHGRLCA